ncbi:hypothetical protein PV326_000786, partial [Microctonus aethiopoides]
MRSFAGKEDTSARWPAVSATGAGRNTPRGTQGRVVMLQLERPAVSIRSWEDEWYLRWTANGRYQKAGECVAEAPHSGTILQLDCQLVKSHEVHASQLEGQLSTNVADTGWVAGEFSSEKSYCALDESLALRRALGCEFLQELLVFVALRRAVRSGRWILVTGTGLVLLALSARRRLSSGGSGSALYSRGAASPTLRRLLR